MAPIINASRREVMRTIARRNLEISDLRTLVVLGLSLLLAACNNGGKPGY
jgi:hypothetical protein